MSQKAIIIGAGYAGIALANLLGKAGYSVDVYEKNAEPGGRIYVQKQDGFTFDLGPSWYLIPEAFDDYYSIFSENASTRLDLQRLTPGYKVFYENKDPITVQGSLEEDMKTFEAIEPGAGDALRRYIDISQRIYERATQSFLYSNFERPALAMLRDPLLMARVASMSLDKHVSQYVQDQRLKQILEYQAVFLGNSPFELPALYSLMSTLDFKSGVFYPKRGMYSLAEDIQALGDQYDITYHFDSPVQRIVTDEGCATGILLANGQEVHADLVIANADLQHVETNLLAPEDQSFPASYWDKKQPGPGGLIISLGVKGTLPQLTHHSLLFVDAWAENFDAIYKAKTMPENASIYVCNPSKSDPSLAPAGHENLFILVPIPAGLALTKEAEQEYANHYIDQVGTMIGAPDLHQREVSRLIFGPEAFGSRYNAWQYNAFGGQSHLLSQSAVLRTRNKSKKVKNLYYVGAGTLPGIGLPMCLISAQQTFKKIAGLKQDGPLSASDIDQL